MGVPTSPTTNEPADDDPSELRPHAWRALKAGGRVCDNCLRVQIRGEFDDTPNCPGIRP